MCSIESLGISGIRGYSPEGYQKINFLKPLTLIWGKNGSGKTTIIECLKYITTGALPPNSDKGKSFIMDTKVAGKPEVIGDIRLIFKTPQQPILVKRRILLSTKGNKSKFESIEQVLTTRDQNDKLISINHLCAQIQKQVPFLLGVSKPILQNIVFCHQEESLWPFGESVMLKKIFDELFQTNIFTKQMQKMWDVHKLLQSKLKELKIRLEYEKQTYQKQIEEKQKAFLELEQIRVSSQKLKFRKQNLDNMKNQLISTADKSKERDQLILRQGRLISSIKALEGKIRTWKQTLLRVERSHHQKMQGKSNKSFDADQPIAVSSGFNMGFGEKPFSELEIRSVQMLEIDSAEKGIEELQEKRQLFDGLNMKYNSMKDQYESLKAFKETSKRQQEIKSEQDRVKSFLPELKPAKDFTRSDEDFLRLFKQKLTEMEQKLQGIDMNKQKIRNIDRNMPPVVQIGFNEKEMEAIRQQSRQLQAQMSAASVQILKIYKVQFKLVSDRILSLMELNRGNQLEKQAQSVNAILASKQMELIQYEGLAKSQEHLGKAALEKTIHHYRITGVEIQDEMLHFCMQKKRCYFCSKPMTEQDISTARQKVELVKEKAQDKLEQLEARRGGQSVNPEAMVKKLKEQISKLSGQYGSLREKVKRFEQQKKGSNQAQKNSTLSKELHKCNLSISMLQKLGHVIEPNSREYENYSKVQIEQFIQMSSAYQIKLARYRGVKQQSNKIQNNKRENEINQNRRQLLIQEKAGLQKAIRQAESQTKGYDFLKGSYQKLQSLVRMDGKKRSRKVKEQQSQESRSLTIEQAQGQVKEVYRSIMDEKISIQKLQIAIGYFNDKALLKQEQQQLQKVEEQLMDVGEEIKESQSLQISYNKQFVQVTRMSQRHNHQLQAVTTILSTPLKASYLATLYRMKHVEGALASIDQSYHMMEEAVNQYHSQKMQQINMYIAEVWRDIYHGQDIDYIEIETTIDPSAKKKKTNYHYRIVMKKNTKNFGNRQEKLEMKGRCSMGQKVLASIVIRLALAEVFCSSTRILALDEPTTNLDKQHIQNLAQALLRLIELSGGKNFQLIIITHDVDLIQLLEQYTDSYYEVRRDQNKFSTIEKRMIRDILRKY